MVNDSFFKNHLSFHHLKKNIFSNITGKKYFLHQSVQTQRSKQLQPYILLIKKGDQNNQSAETPGRAQKKQHLNFVV
jgi:hypothetical protein